MPSLQVRDFPDALYRKLVDRARQEHRTIAQEATVLLSEALGVSPLPKERRRMLLQRLSERPTYLPPTAPTPEMLIREDRDR
jgi:plasmid stability protein